MPLRSTNYDICSLDKGNVFQCIQGLSSLY